MPLNRLRRAGVGAWVLLWLLPLVAAGQDVFTGVERVVAVGDVHGDFEQLVAVLRAAGLIDEQRNWTGGKTHLVQTGDVLDRGPDSRKAMDLLMELEKQARKAGGRVLCLIGNHEAMNIYGDLRYVNPAEFAAFSNGKDPEPDPSKPRGFAEHRRQFGPDGKYGRWIRSHTALVKIDDTVFVHGGISPKYAGYGIRKLNDRGREELQDFTKLEGGVVADTEGPLWYRGLASGDEKEFAPQVEEILQQLGAKRIVVGHTFTDGAVAPRFGGKVVVIDIGLARLYDDKLRQACLVIERGQPYALHRGKLIELTAGSPEELLRYYRAAAALDPPPSPLAERIQQLSATVSAP